MFDRFSALCNIVSHLSRGIYCVICFGLWAFSVPLIYSQSDELPLLSLLDHAEYIVRAKVVSAAPYWFEGTDGRLIKTKFELEVLDWIRGNGGVTHLTIEQRGGRIGETTLRVSNVATFSPNEEVILLLRSRPVAVIGGSSGKFSVREHSVDVDGRSIDVLSFMSALRRSSHDRSSLEQILQRRENKSIPAGDVTPAPRQSSKEATLKMGSPPGVESDPKNGPGLRTKTTYFVYGIITSLSIGSDYDGDGYPEDFIFEIGIDGDVNPGPASVCGKVICVTTGQSWWSTTSWSIIGNVTDYRYLNFSQKDFAGYSSGNTPLDFTVELWDSSKTTLLASNTLVRGEPMIVDYVPTPRIDAIVPTHAAAGIQSEIKIVGSNFGPSSSGNSVEFFYRDGASRIVGSVVSWSSSEIVCIVPIATIGGYDASASSGPVRVRQGTTRVSNEFDLAVDFSYGGIRWHSGTVTFRINENAQGCDNEGAAVINAANSWNSSGADISLVYGGLHTRNDVGLNASNDILWGLIDDPSTLAEAYYWSIGDELQECDMKFNTARSWSATVPVPSNCSDVESVALHEFGHWLNLRDLYGRKPTGPNDMQKAMLGLSGPGDIKRNLHPRDVEGIRWIYGSSTAVWTISGTIREPGRQLISGVALAGFASTTFSSSDGSFFSYVTPGWSGVITPSLAGRVFEPASRTFTGVNSDIAEEDFESFPERPLISGFVRTTTGEPVRNVILSGFPEAVETDASGYYSGGVSHRWSGTITPSKPGCIFDPVSRTVTGVKSDIAGESFESFPERPLISGFFRTTTGVPVGNVILSGFPEAVETDSKGYYSCGVTHGWSGTITPSKLGCTFDPCSTSYPFQRIDQRSEYTVFLPTVSIFGESHVPNLLPGAIAPAVSLRVSSITGTPKLSSITVRRSGTATDADIPEVLLALDVNRNGTIEREEPQLASPKSFSNGLASFTGLEYSPSDSENILIAFVVSPNIASWRTAGVTLYYSDIQGSSGTAPNFSGYQSGLWRLSVEIVDFRCLYVNGQFKLTWIAQRDTLWRGIAIDRRIVNPIQLEWAEAAFLTPKGKDGTPVEYAYSETFPTPGKYEYRLRRVKMDGSERVYEMGEVEVPVPQNISLSESFPNPFNGSTEIVLSLDKETDVRVEIFNVLGEEVTVLMDEPRMAGTHRIAWDASQYPSGTYFWRLTTLSGTMIRRLLLVK